MEKFLLSILLTVLIIYGLVNFRIKNRKLSFKIIMILFLIFIIINPLQLLLVERITSFDLASIIASNLIAACILIINVNEINMNQKVSSSLVIIVASLIGIVSYTNFLIIVGLSVVLIYFFLIIFFNHGVSKEFNNFLTSIIAFLSALMFLAFNAVYITILDDSTNPYPLFLLSLLGYGIIFGIFPFMFSYYKLYKNSTFLNTMVLMLIQYSFSFIFLRNVLLVNEIGVALIMIVLGITGMIISAFNSLVDFFFHFGKKGISLRKTISNLFMLDINNFLILYSYPLIIGENSLLNTILIYVFLTVLTKLMLIFPIYYKIKHNKTDDIQKIGNLFEEERILGLIALASGFLVAFPASVLSFNIIISGNTQFNSIIQLIFAINYIFHLIYLAITITIFSSISIKMNFSKVEK